MDSLPAQLLSEIISHLQPAEKMQVLRVNHRLNAAVQCSSAWSRITSIQMFYMTGSNHEQMLRERSRQYNNHQMRERREQLEYDPIIIIINNKTRMKFRSNREQQALSWCRLMLCQSMQLQSLDIQCLGLHSLSALFDETAPPGVGNFAPRSKTSTNESVRHLVLRINISKQYNERVSFSSEIAVQQFISSLGYVCEQFGQAQWSLWMCWDPGFATNCVHSIINELTRYLPTYLHFYNSQFMFYLC